MYKLINKKLTLGTLIVLTTTPLVLFSCARNAKVGEEDQVQAQALSSDPKYVGTKFLSKKSYNNIVDDLQIKNDYIAIVIIYNGKYKVHYLKHQSSYSILDYLEKDLINIYNFETKKYFSSGIFLGKLTVLNKMEESNTINKKYPLTYVNHKSEMSSVSSSQLVKGQIVEITYDHNS